MWARAYGDDSPTTRRLAEMLVERGDLAGAVDVWRSSDPVRQNPAGLHAEHLNALEPDDRLDDDDPGDWAFTEGQRGSPPILADGVAAVSPAAGPPAAPGR
ncbi:hypothetical protein [Streptomyces flavalbus]|uniref:Tetratricopeptide repeat protein n=1 Tax=Streptomyces flavalbus TaxID=2665155 RepID=A0ABW2WK66_9ACTN